VIIIFIIIFAYQQLVSSLLTPVAFPRKESSQKRFEQDWEEHSMMQYTKFPVAFFSCFKSAIGISEKKKTKFSYYNKLNAQHQCVIL
jgi:hypothetical protein